MRVTRVASAVTGAAVLLVLFALAYEGKGIRRDDQQQARVVELQQAQILALEKALREAKAKPAASAPPELNGTSATRQHWYWTDLVMDSLRPFKQLSGGITMEGLRLAEQKCKQSTYCHRAQVSTRALPPTTAITCDWNGHRAGDRRPTLYHRPARHLLRPELRARPDHVAARDATALACAQF